MKRMQNIFFAVSVLFVTLAWANLSSDVWAKDVNNHEDVVVKTGEIIPGSYAQVGNHTMSVPETEETMRFRFRKSSVPSSADPPANANVVDFNDNSGLTVSPPMAPYYGLASTFTIEGNSLLVTLEEGKGIFLQSSPIATKGGTVVATAWFLTNSRNVSIALGLLNGAWGDPDGSNGLQFYTSGSDFFEWTKVTVRFFSKKEYVTPFLQVATNEGIPNNAVGTNGVQVKSWIVSREGDSPPEPQPEPVVADYKLSGSTLFLNGARDKLQVPTDAGTPEILGDSIGWRSGMSTAITETEDGWSVSLDVLPLRVGYNRLNARVSQKNWLLSSNFRTPVGSDPLWHMTTSGVGTGQVTIVIELNPDGTYSLVPAGTYVATQG